MKISNDDSFFSFKTNILSVNDEQASERILFSNRNAKILKFSTILIALTDLFWIIYGLLSDDPYGIISVYGLSACILQFSISIIMFFFVCFHKNRTSMFYRIVQLIYQIGIIISVTLFLISKNIKMSDAGIIPAFAGIPLSTLYLFSLCVVPIPYMQDTFILGLFFVAGYIVPEIAPGASSYSMLSHGILRLFVIACYLVVYYVNNTNTLKQIHIGDLNDKLFKQTFIDDLTNTLNKKALEKMYNKYSNNPDISTIGIIIFDFDHFRGYNTYYSHAEGDIVLRETARLIDNMLKDDNTFLFRYSGDEFVTILPDANDISIAKLGKKINNLVYNENTFRTDIDDLDRLTVSVGCAVIHRADFKDCDYVSYAEKELLLAKENGRNCVVLNKSKVE